MNNKHSIYECGIHPPDSEKPTMQPACHLAADLAVEKCFALIGVDVYDPESVERFREDLRFSKKLRGVAEKGLIWGLGAFLSVIGAAIWIFLEDALNGR